MDKPENIQTNRIVSISGENLFQGTLQKLISHYVKWPALAEANDEEKKKQWVSELSQLLVDLKSGLNDLIDQRVDEKLGKQK